MVWCPGESGDQPVSCVEIDPKVVLLREKILPVRWWGVGNGKRFSLLVRNGLFSLNLRVPGEFCTGWALRWVLPGEFCPACGLVPRASALYGACWPNFVARGCHMGCCWEGFVWVLGGVVAGENSPCSVVGRWEREKILPAREKWPVFVEFEGAGRVLYRLGLEVGVPGEFCPGWALRWALPGEFCTACGLVPRASALCGACWPNFVARGCHMGCCWEGFVWVLGGVVAGENSPCSVVARWEREKILPAREKWPVFVESEGAGRVLYRLGLEVGVQGEFCPACGLTPRASALYGARWPNFIARWRHPVKRRHWP